MLTILSLTGPLFLLIAIGYVCVWRGVLPGEGLAVMGRYVMVLAMPALLFRSLVQQRVADVLEPRYLAVYALGSVSVFLAGFLYSRAAHGLGTTASAFRAIGMSASNSGFVGLPLVLQVIGPHAVVPAALTFIVENLVMLPLLIGFAESGVPGHAGAAAIARRVAGSLVRTPLILSMIAAGIGLALGVRPTGVVARAIEMLAASSGPVALIVIGGTLYGLSAKGLVRPVSEVVVGKLVLLPLAMVLFLLLIPVGDRDLRHAAVLLASTQMLSIYPVLAQPYGEQRFCAAAQLVANLSAFFTISTWLWLLAGNRLPI